MRTHGETSAPQWSPPVMGGMTLTRVRLPPRPRQAAMEPARNGRDDRHVDLHPAQDGLAAMEPARNGRDDSADSDIRLIKVEPQWSPPVMGGMTARTWHHRGPGGCAAMEPARNGRDDRQGHRAAVAGPGAAMEPARNGRDDPATASSTGRWSAGRNGRDDLTQSRYSQIGTGPPQWSPPVMGGMTLGRRRRRERDPRRAAMEPARNGRDDDRDRLPGHVDREAAMEPARNGRDDPMIVAGETGAPRVPQWSPPVMGGMTWLSVTLLASVSWPQWSPPVMGGMTGCTPRGRTRCSCRNGARP